MLLPQLCYAARVEVSPAACAFWRIRELLQACVSGRKTAASPPPPRAAQQRESASFTRRCCLRASRAPCRFPVDWSPPPVSPSSNFSTSLCVVTYDDDSFCSNNSVGLISPPVCLPLSIPAPQPRWTAGSNAQPMAEDGTFPVFVGAVGCRSFFVAAAADANYDIIVDSNPKLPPGVSLVSR